MRNNMLIVLICLVSILLSGCLAKDENPDWNPSAAFPSWTYDAPFYHEPATPLKPETSVGDDIPVYYTRDADFFIRHPNGWQQNLAPQVALWYSNTCGESWLLDGYYGLEQRYFIFHAEHDGHYWIRFVGPAPGKDSDGKDNDKGQGVATVPPGQPHEIYVVDTHAPTINVTVTPSPWKDEERTVRHIYKVGDEVELQWSVTDMSLLEGSISLGTAFAKFPNNVVWSKFDGKIDPIGKMKVTIPPEACKYDGIRFRMLAEDKAKNVGIGMTDILHVAQADRPEGPKIKAPEKAAAETGTIPEELLVPTPITTAPEPKPKAISKKVHPAAALIEPIQIVKPRDPRGIDENEFVKPRSQQTNKWISQLKPASDSSAKASEPTLAGGGESSDNRRAGKLSAVSIEALLPDSFEDTTPAPAKTSETRLATRTVKKAPSAELLEKVVVDKSHEDENLAPIAAPLEELALAVAETPTETLTPAPKAEPQLDELTTAFAPTQEPIQKTVERKPLPRIFAQKPKQIATTDTSSGWNLAGEKLNSGTSRLFTVQPTPALNGKSLQLQFSSDGGNQWTSLKDDMKPGRTIMWAVPSVDSDNCRLRIVSVNSDGTTPLATSPKFAVNGPHLENAVARVQK